MSDLHNMPISSTSSPDFARRIYDDVLAWYNSADSKAQVILAIDGVFLGFITSSIFVAPDEIRQVVGTFESVTWSLLALMTITLLTSVGCAVYCLWSRIYSKKSLKKFVDAAQRNSPNPGLYTPEIMWFFQMLTTLDKDKFVRTLEQAGTQFEQKALASQIHILSENIRKKHLAINLGFLLAACTFVLFFVAGVLYLNHVL